METPDISIREIQHYLYCPHRWGLINIDCSWAENFFVTKADLLHQRVHDPDHSYSLKGKKVLTGVTVYNDALGLFGVTDCIELTEDPEGIVLDNFPGKYRLAIVEYKPTSPKGKVYNHDDLMQVFAQKVCVDSIFNCSCDGIIYYADTKKRMMLPLKESYSSYLQELKVIIQAIQNNRQSGTIPPIRVDQKCGGCSIKEICMPRTNRKADLREMLENI
jgi:CRISPR-associated exonuclease Cas4